jgi:hypothetical protein
MGIRDEELKRIEKYAQGLGIKVTYKKQGPQDPEADWAVDGSEITVYLRNRQSKTHIILDLIHELGHHMYWVHNDRKIPIKLDTALSRENPTKKQRKAILEDEQNGALYHLLIYKELGLKIPEWKVIVERDIQLEIYKYYYRNGDFPTVKERKIMRKKLNEKYSKSK